MNLNVCDVVESGTDVRVLEGFASHFHFGVAADTCSGERPVNRPPSISFSLSPTNTNFARTHFVRDAIFLQLTDRCEILGEKKTGLRRRFRPHRKETGPGFPRLSSDSRTKRKACAGDFTLSSFCQHEKLTHQDYNIAA
jgi:hypothetical protein